MKLLLLKNTKNQTIALKSMNLMIVLYTRAATLTVVLASIYLVGLYKFTYHILVLLSLKRPTSQVCTYSVNLDYEYTTAVYSV